MVSTVGRMRRASRSCLVPKIARTRKLNIPVSYLTPSPAEDRRSHGTAAVAEQPAGGPARRPRGAPPPPPPGPPPPPPDPLLSPRVVRGGGGEGCEVGRAEHLAAAGGTAELLPDHVGHPPTDPGVHLVEHHGRHLVRGRQD